MRELNDGMGAWIRHIKARGILPILGLILTAAASAQTPTQTAAVDLPDAPTSRTITPAPAPFEDGAKTEEPLTLRKLPARFLTDELHIFTSPARIHKTDLKWILPLAGATAAALSTDSYTIRHVVSHDPGFNNVAENTSEVIRDTYMAIPVGLFLAGSARGDAHTREAGLLGGEAVIDAQVFDEVIKYAALRERPYQDDARGRFFAGNAVGDPSFLSGHSAVTWSSAAVLAEEYHKPWQQVAIYTIASGTSISRVLANDHFPTDVLVGSAAGWLIGHYVYRAHHRANQLVRTVVSASPRVSR